MSHLKTISLAGLLMICCAPGLAEDLADDAEIVSSEAVEALSAFESSAAMSDKELNAHRAKENLEIDQIIINDQEQDGNVSDNVAVGNTTGNNTISDSYAYSSGFYSTVQNTGNNVLIQHSTIINVSIEATP